MTNTTSLTRYILVKQILVALALNLIINAAISYLTFGQFESVSVWDKNPVFVDILLTSLLLSSISCYINSRIIIKQIRTNKLRLVGHPKTLIFALHKVSIFNRSVGLGVVIMLTVGVPVLLLMKQWWPNTIEVIDFVLFKGVFSSVLAGLLAYPIAIWAINEAIPETQAAR
jgi:hypothetical protein